MESNNNSFSKEKAIGLLNKIQSRKTAKNASWLLASRIINIASGLLVSVIVTRYLGKELKGVLAYISSTATFLSFFVKARLGDILVK